MKSDPAIIFIVFISIFLSSCTNSHKKSDYPDSDLYNLSNPKVINLPVELDEISGITYYPKDTSVFAITDEDGMLYKIPLNRPNQLRSWRFDKKRDYEDMLYADSTFYVLVSNGDVMKVNFVNDKLISTKIDLSDVSKKENEFESMFLDSNKIVIVCKTCDIDSKNQTSLFAWNLTDSVPAVLPHFSLEYGSVLKNKPRHLKPSAAAVNPYTNEIYFISAIENMLIVTSLDGKLKASYKLDPKIYKQPEGIAFTPKGDLIISNEFAEKGTSNLLLMKNKKK